MKKFILFVGGLVALMLLIINLGPMVLLGVGLWLLYVVFKKFVKSDSLVGKMGWVVVGLLVLSFTVANVYAVVGILAAYVLYLIFKSWRDDKDEPVVKNIDDTDPFTNFERQWADLNR